MTETKCEICERYPYGFGRGACDCNKPPSVPASDPPTTQDREAMNARELMAWLDLLQESDPGSPADTQARKAIGAELASLRVENERLREQFSIDELAELCSATGGATGEIGHVSDHLRAKLVQMWNQANRAASRSTTEKGE